MLSPLTWLLKSIMIRLLLRRAKYPAPCRIAAVGFRALAPEPDLQLSLYPALHPFTVCTVNFRMTAFTDHQSFSVNLLHKSCPRLTFIQLFQRSYLVHYKAEVSFPHHSHRFAFNRAPRLGLLQNAFWLMDNIRFFSQRIGVSGKTALPQ